MVFSEARAITKDCSFISRASGSKNGSYLPQNEHLPACPVWCEVSRSRGCCPTRGLGPGGGITPPVLGLPRHPAAGAGLGAAELTGNVVLIYTHLLSFYKTIAVYEKSLLS